MLRRIAGGLLCLFTLSLLPAQQGEFATERFVGGFEQAIGLTFDANGRMYVWEKAGRIWIVEKGKKAVQPLLDISEEVGNWRDFGLLSVALDPDFLSNGHIYLYYQVDRHHLLNFGTARYNPTTNEYFSASIGRVTRYSLSSTGANPRVDYGSRKVLLGETPQTGVPSLTESHVGGSLAFGADGTLLLTTGDGASYQSLDQGSAGETYYQQALADGILRLEENIGSYRSQSLSSLCGKVLRIDPNNGDGLPSNPWYDPARPRSPQSRIFALGLRNPFRMTFRPGSGKHNPELAQPGAFYIGDVGSGTREELSVLDAPKQNFGWPKYEGMTFQGGYNNAAWSPVSHDLPKLDWRLGEPRAYKDGRIHSIGSAAVPGAYFQGNCSMGGAWYQGKEFPTDYKGTFFFTDYGEGWIRAAIFDTDDEPQRILEVLENTGPITYLESDPKTGDMYYVANGSTVWKLIYRGLFGRAPIAKIEADTTYGLASLKVNFSSSRSYDPEYFGLEYSWDFGDGTPLSNSPNPSHLFQAKGTGPQRYLVKLRITDRDGYTGIDSLPIVLNNLPPQILSTSLDDISRFDANTVSRIPLKATVQDRESDLDKLEYSWQLSLFHNDHFHAEPLIPIAEAEAVLSAIGCEEEAMYWFRVELTVSDEQGLRTTYTKDLYPNCGGQAQTLRFAQPDTFSTDSPYVLLKAEASSGLPVEFYIVEGPAYVSGDTLFLKGTPGEVVVRATQRGNAAYNSAPVVERSIEIVPGQPQLFLRAPAEGDTLSGSEVGVQYNFSGNFAAAGADHLLLRLDQGPWIPLYRFTGSYTLENILPGPHTVEMRIADKAHRPLSPIQSRNFVSTPGGEGRGLSAVYHGGKDFGPVLLSRIDPTIDFNWEGDAPAPNVPADNFSVRWEGEILLPNSGEYTFATSTDDGVRLWIDGKLAIDQWIDQGTTTYTYAVKLTAGKRVPVKMEYYENGGGAAAKLEWESERIDREVIPARYLFPKDGKSLQRLFFTPIPEQALSKRYVLLKAGSNSGLPLNFTLLSGPGKIVKDTLFFNAVGEIRLRAEQPGNAAYEPAQIEQRFQVVDSLSPAGLAFTFPANGDTLSGEIQTLRFLARGALEGREQILVLLDGRELGVLPWDGLSWTLQDLRPGTYSVLLQLLDADLNPLTQSDTLRFTIVAPSTNCPSPQGWSATDIGDTDQVGFACGDGQNFVIGASGADIWGFADAFHFVYRQLDGDGEISARVEQIVETDPWAKAGVMVRSGLSAEARHFMLVGTPANGVNFQGRYENGQESYSQGLGGALPVWVKIARFGDALLAFTSADGKNWNFAALETLKLDATVFAGLAVTSHNNQTRTQAELNQVAFVSYKQDKPDLSAPKAPTAQAQSETEVLIGLNSLLPQAWGYRLERSLDADGPYTPIAYFGPTPDTFTDEVPTPGTYYYRLVAFNASGYSPASQPVELNTDPDNPCAAINLALGKAVTVSSVSSGDYLGAYAVDGKLDTRWSSQYADPQWISVDLGADYDLCRVILRWEAAKAETYRLEISRDARNWTTLCSAVGGGPCSLPTGPNTGRYLRMSGTKRATPYGYSLWEIEAYGRKAPIATNALKALFYPVPTGKELHISYRGLGQEPATLTLSDMLGRIVYRQTWISGAGMQVHKVAVQGLAKGWYGVELSHGGERVWGKVGVE